MSGPLNRPAKVLIIGAGNRGQTYARYAETYPEQVHIIGVAEPRSVQREQMAKRYQVEPRFVFDDWQAALAQPRFADAVVIATQDEMHQGPAVKAAELGYHILLEKPLAPTEAECRRIVSAVKRAGVMLAVGHVLRYTAYTEALKAVLDSGRLGKIVSVQHLEPVGHTHQAHSFVRGHWRNTAESSPMLLAKSCHDLDWLSYLLDEPCQAVSSFGQLGHFKRSEQPDGAGERCLECPAGVRQACPYDAERYYLGHLAAGHLGWPIETITDNPTLAGIHQALLTGPYGRCVYACDNDVVDHQVVNFRFESGATATFTMTAFTQGRGRETHIFGTRGELYGDSRRVRIFDFLTEQTEEIDTEVASDGSILSGHGGGDFGLMAAFVRAVRTSDPTIIRSGPDQSLASHLIVFRAEEARLSGKVEQILE